MTVSIERITQCFKEDQEKSTVVRHQSEIPASFELISAAWLSEVLCEDIPEAKVVSFVLGPADDGTSNRRRIFVEYNDEGQASSLPSSVFCKASMGLENRITLGMMGCAHSEATFFNKVRPRLDIEAPEAFLANYNKESYAAIAVLKDIGNKVEFCDEKTYIDQAKAESQVELLAELHAKFMGDAKPLVEKYQFAFWPDWFANLQATIQMEEYCQKGFLAAKAVIPPRLYARSQEIWPATLKSIETHINLPATVLHGDTHVKNWYYVPVEQKMGLGDWQAVVIGHWSRDFAYTVASSLDVADRRNWERGLLSSYLDALNANGVDEIPFNEAWMHYKQQLFSALAYWTITLTPSPHMPEMQPEETTLMVIKRLTHAIDDLNALDSFL